MNYQIIYQLTATQTTELVDLYQKEFWSKNRTNQDVIKMLAASDIVIGLIDENKQLVGFTRVLTDFVYRATIYDVIIKHTHRKQGLGAKLMDAVVYHPQLSTVENITLYCLPEMMPFYQRWGFKTDDVNNLHLMFRYNEGSRQESIFVTGI